ncbi:hypothetical protein [Pseudonocardia nigra]|uniref:hypothetical protein n=1 Tax=Pseudonocardia nigra TaxID=1921578 RepID=UPI001C5ED314|nr:hypothetical protein [Pseudonocardia nigra]
MNVKKAAGWTAMAFLVWFVVAQPSGAAGTVHGMGNMMQNAAEGMSTFITSMF